MLPRSERVFCFLDATVAAEAADGLGFEAPAPDPQFLGFGPRRDGTRVADLRLSSSSRDRAVLVGLVDLPLPPGSRRRHSLSRETRSNYGATRAASDARVAPTSGATPSTVRPRPSHSKTEGLKVQDLTSIKTQEWELWLRTKVARVTQACSRLAYSSFDWVVMVDDDTHVRPSRMALALRSYATGHERVLPLSPSHL